MKLMWYLAILFQLLSAVCILISFFAPLPPSPFLGDPIARLLGATALFWAIEAHWKEGGK